MPKPTNETKNPTAEQISQAYHEHEEEQALKQQALMLEYEEYEIEQALKKQQLMLEYEEQELQNALDMQRMLLEEEECSQESTSSRMRTSDSCESVFYPDGSSEEYVYMGDGMWIHPDDAWW